MAKAKQVDAPELPEETLVRQITFTVRQRKLLKILAALRDASINLESHLFLQTEEDSTKLLVKITVNKFRETMKILECFMKKKRISVNEAVRIQTQAIPGSLLANLERLTEDNYQIVSSCNDETGRQITQIAKRN